MECPFCNTTKTHVKDSRPTPKDKRIVKRRRYCDSCGAHWITFEIPITSQAVMDRIEFLNDLIGIPTEHWPAINDLIDAAKTFVRRIKSR